MGGGSDSAESTGNLPWWVRGPHQNLIRNAEDFVYGDSGGYVPFPDQRIAGLSAPELASQEARQELFNRGDIAGQFAGQQLGFGADAASGIAGAAFDQFHTSDMEARMSPFMEGVINPQIREADQAFDRQLRNTNAESIARGGSIGDHRLGIERALLEGQRAESLGDIRGRGLQQAYDQAYDSFLQDRNSRVQGLTQAGDLYGRISAAADAVGTGSQNRSIQQISELERSGAVNRELAQREMDLAYRDFIEERDFPVQRMQFLSQMLSGIPTQQLASTSTNPANPGLLSQLTSLGLGAAAVQQAFSGDGG